MDSIEDYTLGETTGRLVKLTYRIKRGTKPLAHLHTPNRFLGHVLAPTECEGFRHAVFGLDNDDVGIHIAGRR